MCTCSSAEGLERIEATQCLEQCKQDVVESCNGSIRVQLESLRSCLD